MRTEIPSAPPCPRAASGRPNVHGTVTEAGHTCSPTPPREGRTAVPGGRGGPARDRSERPRAAGWHSAPLLARSRPHTRPSRWQTQGTASWVSTQGQRSAELTARRTYRDGDPKPVRRREDIRSDPHRWKEGGSLPTGMENATGPPVPASDSPSLNPARISGSIRSGSPRRGPPHGPQAGS